MGGGDTKALWEALDMSITLIVVMFPLVFMYFHTHQIVHIQYVLFFVPSRLPWPETALRQSCMAHNLAHGDAAQRGGGH